MLRTRFCGHRPFIRPLMLSVIFISLALSGTPDVVTAGDVVSVSLVTDVVEGQGSVGLRVAAHGELKDVTLELAGPWPKKRFPHGAMDAGDEHFFVIPQKAGTVAYTGHLKVVFEDGTHGAMPLSFSLRVLEGLIIRVPEDRFDRAGRALIIEASRPVARVAYQVISDTGAILDKGERKADGEPSVSFPLAWSGQEGTIIRIDLTVYDVNGTFAQMELSPWFVDVEHEEVNFPSGSADITPSEAPKLERAYEHVKRHIEKYGALVKLNLYIVGYTDTVGAVEYNRDLSQRRARAIARFIRSKGFAFPIYYQGFGEDVLAVPTPDETDEPRNRRALYLLGGSQKPSGGQIPAANWKLLE